MNLIAKRNLFFALSLIILVPGVIALFTWGLKLGIDFTGGTLWEVKFVEKKENVTTQSFQAFLNDIGAEASTVSTTSDDSILARLKINEEAKLNDVKSKVKDKYGQVEDVRLETVGPTISKELTQKALLAVAISILAIVSYITYSFRKVPKPASSIAFGVCTVVALVHDVIVVVGIFAIIGHFTNIEIDSLFITALLTVIGFSVHDTIVVFDRIRENLLKHSGYDFPEIVNHSLLQTLGRSLNTSLTAIFVLIALFLFGGESIKTFVLALLIGMISGTYSSIFNAAPLLVVWHNLSTKRKKS
ncbi:MAG: protein translocase subunit SecF [Patescibacteria group bacterium]